MSWERIERHRTALYRTELSRPLRQALGVGLVGPGTTVFDYGCGRGDDVRSLGALGVAAAGWDPAHRPDAPVALAAVVNLGYVVNVIEDPVERARTLARAWALARGVLLVSAQLRADAKPDRAVAHGDGYLTRVNTFQKYYTQAELSDWIEGVLGVPPIPLAPGVFAVFRSADDRELYLARRVRRRASGVPRPARTSAFERHREVLGPLLGFLTERGRPPAAGELAPEHEAEVRRAFGSLGKALRKVVEALGADAWQAVQAARAEDLLVYLALSRLRRRPRFQELPPALQGDVRSFFGNYTSAVERGDAMLRAAGDNATREQAFARAAVGKFTGNALYVHASAIDALAPILRVVEGCARAVAGEVEGATVVKLHRHKPLVSYLAYPEFDTVAHPELRGSLFVDLRTLRLDLRDYAASESPPVLHRKEEFVPPGYPHRERFVRLTQQEERKGLYADPERIGTRRGWEAALRAAGVEVRGHRLFRRDQRATPNDAGPPVPGAPAG